MIIFLNTEEVCFSRMNKWFMKELLSTTSSVPFPVYLAGCTSDPYLGAQELPIQAEKHFLRTSLKSGYSWLEKSLWGQICLSKRTYHLCTPFHLFQKKGGNGFCANQENQVSYFDIKSESLLFHFPWPLQRERGDSQGRFVNDQASDLDEPPQVITANLVLVQE